MRPASGVRRSEQAVSTDGSVAGQAVVRLVLRSDHSEDRRLGPCFEYSNCVYRVT